LNKGINPPMDPSVESGKKKKKIIVDAAGKLV
jgi:hypothetical protein